MRQLERRPWRALLSTLGLAMALAILIFSFFMEDTMDYMLDIQYGHTQREDLSVQFTRPRDLNALQTLRALPGVLVVEPMRVVPVNLINGHLEKRSAITGLPANPQLHRVIDEQLKPVTLDVDGLVMNTTLANLLGLSVGDTVRVEVLDEKRQRLSLTVAATTQEFMGMGVYMNLHALSRQLDESPKMTGATLLLDTNHSAMVYKKLKQIPAVVGLNIVSVLRQVFEDIMAENLLKMVGVNLLFACFISVGVIYNTARIALGERERELASLRVLGLTEWEVAVILFGELTAITLAAIPMGMFIGYQLALGTMQSMDSELFRLPLYIENSTYGLAVAVLLVSSLLCFYLVWRRLDRVSLAAAQKGVE